MAVRLSRALAIVDEVMWSESECNDGGGDLGFYHSEVAGGLRMKWDRSEVFLGMGDEDATLSCEGESNDTECIIKLQDSWSCGPSDIGSGTKY